MKERIETLEQLNELLSPDISFSLGWSRAETTVEKMTWHLLESLPFEIDIILKGTCAWEDGIKREAYNTVELLDERYGEKFTIDNKELMDWLLSTPLENLAAYVARVVRRQEFNKISNYYDAAQDYYADHWDEWDDYLDKKISPREFIIAMKGHVETVNNHIAEGKELGLTMDEIVLHDCTWGLLPEHFDPDNVSAARDILKEAMRRLPSRPYIWSEIGKRSYAPAMLEFASDRLLEADIDIDLHNSYTTEQGYLLDFFSRLYWREAATRPE